MRWWSGYLIWGMMLWIGMAGLGCRHTISAPVRQQAKPPVPFVELRQDPDAFTGRTVIVGGDILSPRNTEQHTFIEVLQKPLDAFERPLSTDQTEGRFMARCESYLDPALYAKGRQVTIAGRVLGSFTGKVGEAQYVYPLINCIEIHLWPQLSASAYDTGSYFYPWYWHPHFHPFYPYPYPFFYPPYRYRY